MELEEEELELEEEELELKEELKLEEEELSPFAPFQSGDFKEVSAWKVISSAVPVLGIQLFHDFFRLWLFVLFRFLVQQHLRDFC